MIYLSPDQEKLLKIFQEHQSIKYAQIGTMTGWTLPSIRVRCLALVKKGAVERKGNQRFFTYHVAEDLEYEVTFDGNEPKSEPLPDTSLDDLSKFDFNAEEFAYVKANLHRSRRELARALGISKLQLNQAMEKHQLKSKVTKY